MNDIDSMITALYQKEQGAPDLEKTAAENFLAQLQTDGQVAEERPYADLSTAELIKLAQEIEDSPDEEGEERDEELEKVAFEMLGGQTMAHACVHELDLIKEAVVNGLCRVCKENPMDVEDSSICQACSASE
jgi:hypothetical protein